MSESKTYSESNQIKPLIRRDLVIVRSNENGDAKYTVKDPQKGKFFQIGRNENLILSLMNGKRTFDQIRETANIEHGITVSVPVIEKFYNTATRAGLLALSSGSGGFQESEKSRLPKGFLSNPFYVRAHIFNPDRLLSRLAPHFSFAFQSGFAMFTVAVFIFCLSILISDFDEFLVMTGNLKSITGLFLLYATSIVVVMIHEMGHGIACKHFGGQVPSIGALVMMLVLPCFYTDVSDAWMFSKKRHRLWVMASGVYIESVIWSFSVVVWQVTAAGTIVNNIALAVLASSSVGMLLTLNPLLKFDGYYLLSDALEIPNLRDKSFAYLSFWLGGVVLGNKKIVENVSKREKWIYLTFGILSLSLMLLIILALVSRLLDYSVKTFGMVATLPVAYLGWRILGPTFKGIWKGMSMKSEESKMNMPKLSKTETNSGALDANGPGDSARGDSPPSPVKQSPSDKGTTSTKRRVAFVVVVLGGILGLALFRAPLEISGDFIVKPREVHIVTSAVSGLVSKVHIREGDLVGSDDDLIDIDQRNLLHEIDEARADLQRETSKLSVLELGPKKELIDAKKASLEAERLRVLFAKEVLERMRQLVGSSLPEMHIQELEHEHELAIKRVQFEQKELEALLAPPRAEELEGLKAGIRKIKLKIARLEFDLSNTKVASKVAGVVVTEEPELLEGRWVNPGDELLTIEGTRSHKAVVSVLERDIATISVGQKVRLKVYGYPGHEFQGRVFRVAPTIAKDNNDVIARSTISVEVEVDDPEGLLKTGMTGHSKIRTTESSYLAQLFRLIIHWFKIEFWW